MRTCRDCILLNSTAERGSVHGFLPAPTILYEQWHIQVYTGSTGQKRSLIDNKHYTNTIVVRGRRNNTKYKIIILQYIIYCPIILHFKVLFLVICGKKKKFVTIANTYKNTIILDPHTLSASVVCHTSTSHTPLEQFIIERNPVIRCHRFSRSRKKTSSFRPPNTVCDKAGSEPFQYSRLYLA